LVIVIIGNVTKTQLRFKTELQLCYKNNAVVESG
jgi:hypothetical protein